MAKKRVLLTGASGTMGGEAFRELLRRRDRYETRLFLRPSPTNIKTFKRYEKAPGVEIVWGDLVIPSDVERAVEGVDFVLHAAAMIPPDANDHPRASTEINVTGTANIVEAVKAQSRSGCPRLVYVGSVSQYGEPHPPARRIKVSDPVGIGVCDHYSKTKVEAEKTVMKSGLDYWVSLRQTYIAIPDVLDKIHPLMFQQPLDQHMEIITARDAGYGLVQCIETPDEFWGRVYNMAGGPSCRVVFIDYMDRLLRIFGIVDYRKVMERNWFALKQHRCGWFEDSYILNSYIRHWRDSLDDHFEQVKRVTRWYVRGMSEVAPNSFIKYFLKSMAYPLKCIEENDSEHIESYFGSREDWESIPSWS